MSDWKERSIKKKDYRRGGLEPDPPRSKSKNKAPKIYRVEYKYNKPLFGKDDWWGFSTYRDLQLALDRIEKLKRDMRQFECSLYKSFRIVNKKTKIVEYLEES